MIVIFESERHLKGLVLRQDSCLMNINSIIDYRLEMERERYGPVI